MFKCDTDDWFGVAVVLVDRLTLGGAEQMEGAHTANFVF